jgi:hypothetical protein
MGSQLWTTVVLVETNWLLSPEKLFSRSEVLQKPCPVPLEPGVYGWYFNEVPAHVPLDGIHVHEGHLLLYVGIAPKKPSAAGKASSRTLRDRIRQHYRLNAYGSTLRLSIGSLLGLELRRIASKRNPGTAKRMTFGLEGENRLNEWMEAHARVVWWPCAEPWIHEHSLLKELVLPLNLDANARSPFHSTLKEIRATARARAAERPPLDA